MKLSKTQVKPFLKTLQKLTDNRFTFGIVQNFKDTNKYDLSLHFCDSFVASTAIIDNDFSPENAFDCLVALIQDEHKYSSMPYFDCFGVSFEIYHNCLNGKNYYSFRKNDSDKWVKISKHLAAYILENNEIKIDGKIDNCNNGWQYDAYYYCYLKVNKGCL